MGRIFDNPLELAVLFAVVLALVLELGCRVGARFQIQEEPNRKEQTGHNPGWAFCARELGAGFHTCASRYTLRRAPLAARGRDRFDRRDISSR